MLYLAQKLLQENEHKELRKNLLISSEWKEGIHTTAGDAKQIKKNLQLNSGDAFINASEKIKAAIQNNKKIDNFAFPLEIFNILFSRTGVGMFYGPHVDTPCVEGKRRDLSFTIFLNDKNDYKGGELILYIPPEKRTIKLDAGNIIIYPTKYLHEVKEVTEGERMVCVGWMQSQIAVDDDRENLSMLKRSIAEILNKETNNISSRLNINVALNYIHKRFMSLN